MPKVNVDHTISGQGTGISTLDHLATVWYQTTLSQKTLTLLFLFFPFTESCVNGTVWSTNHKRCLRNDIMDLLSKVSLRTNNNFDKVFASIKHYYVMQVLNFCILYAKYYIFIQHLFNNNTLELYTCLTQLKQK